MQRLGAISIVVVLLGLPACGLPPSRVVVGGEEGPAGQVAAELLAQALEGAGVPVVRRPAIGGARAVHEALRAGEVDVAVEHTGQALQEFQGEPFERDADRAYALVRSRSRAEGLTWLPRLGWNDPPVAVARAGISRARSLDALTQLGAYSLGLRVAVPSELTGPGGGFERLASHYGLGFASRITVAPGTGPSALAADRADVSFTRATDPRIAANGLVVLTDDLGWFPPWEAAPVARAETLKRIPKARRTLEALSGTISTDALRRAAETVATGKQTPARAARGLR